MHSKKSQQASYKPVEPGDFFLPYVNLPRGKSTRNSRNQSLVSDNPENAFTLAGSTMKEKPSHREPTAFLDISNAERRYSNASRNLTNTSLNNEQEARETVGSQSGRLKSSFADSENKPVKSIFSQREVSFRARYADKYRIYYNGLESTSGNTLPSVHKTGPKGANYASADLYSTNFFTPQLGSQGRLEIGSQNTLSLLKEESEDNEYSAINWTSAHDQKDGEPGAKSDTSGEKKEVRHEDTHRQQSQRNTTQNVQEIESKQPVEDLRQNTATEALGWTRLDQDPQVLLEAVRALVQREENARNLGERSSSRDETRVITRVGVDGYSREAVSPTRKTEVIHMTQVMRKFLFGGIMTNQQLLNFGSLLLQGVRFVIEFNEGLTSYQLQAVPLPIIFPDIAHHDRVLMIEPFFLLCYPKLQADNQTMGLEMRNGVETFLERVSRYWKLIFYSSREDEDLKIAREYLDPSNQHKIKLLDRRYCARLVETRGKESKLVKDLSVVADVPLSRKCLIDYKLHSSVLQPNNTVVVSLFDEHTSPQDSELDGLAEYLQVLALSEDVTLANGRIMNYYDL